MRKPAFCICENKDADQLHGIRKADQRLCFAFWKVQYHYFLNSKFQASSHLLWLYNPVCVGPGRKPRRPVFSQRGSNNPKFLGKGYKSYHNAFKGVVLEGSKVHQRKS